MKVFLINLERSTDRLAHMTAQLAKADVVFERVPAVDGKALPEAVRAQSVSRFRSWCAIGAPLRPEELGCALSHARIYRRMIDENLPFACILEDDIFLTSVFTEQVERVARWIDPTLPQVVLLSNYTPERCEAWEIRPAVRDTSTEGYVLTQCAARALLRVNFPLLVQCDSWGRWVKLRVIQLYHAFPTVLLQDAGCFASVIAEGKRFTLATFSPLERIWWKLKRLFGVPLDALLRVFTGR